MRRDLIERGGTTKASMSKSGTTNSHSNWETVFAVRERRKLIYFSHPIPTR
jgi:hypothetical protein